MLTKHFICYKAYNSIDLKNATALFGLPSPEGRDRSVILKSSQLTEIYRYDMKKRRIHIFNTGCIVFEDFSIDETDTFFDNIKLTMGEPDYRMLATYRDNHTLTLTDEGTVSLWKGSKASFPAAAELFDIIAIILAKSTALSKEESAINKLLDDADHYISRFQNGILRISTRRFASAMAHIIKFEQQSAAGIRLFDRPAAATGSLMLRNAYDQLSSYYELEDRYEVLENKATELRNIVRTYSTLRYRRQENRLLGFEIFLLLLFPFSRIVENIVGHEYVETFVRMIFPHLLQKFNIFH